MYFTIIMVVIFLLISAVGTTLITRWISDSRSNKIIKNMANDYAIKSQKKEEVIKDANEKKNQVLSSDAQSSFDASIDILHDLSNRRK